MSKKFPKETKRVVNGESVKNKANTSKNDEHSALQVTVGFLNVKRWNILKASFSCKSNATFASKLLDLAQDYLKRNSSQERTNVNGFQKRDHITNKRRKNTSSKEKNEGAKVTLLENVIKNVTVDDLQQSKQIVPEKVVNYSVSDKIGAIKSTVDACNIDTEDENTTLIGTECKIKKKPFPGPEKKEKATEANKKTDYDVRKAPELILQGNEIKIEDEPINDSSIKVKLCQNCNTHHVEDHCPFVYPNVVISDVIDISNWKNKYQNLHTTQSEIVKSEKDDDDDRFIFAKVSLPSFLQLLDTSTVHGLGVWTEIDIREFTQFGPLIGRAVKEVDIAEDSSMRHIWELHGSTYLDTEDLEISNWMRFVRPASTRDEKNIAVVRKENSLYFISTKLIKKGSELLYWQDSIVPTNKKKMEKTSCGGCNMSFLHPLYYRTHCLVFHDVRYSLTIRKYHCKICGAAVLGKENIMKHAAELHNGQGAYQCQFCKKFFLRLNYLEMHRTYGCSANPHRSRPLCDFCGRKFCQPQKLKVHIKRMHSDFAEVLKEFQCKNCLKILGSRAALQRHLKEVHQKQADGACSCSRCGKHFQNKSNLKIHMLTHSGIKPFRCVVKSCNAAFTTKQCLQFHYKKVHNFNEERMPKIERSIDYTFEAYSGVEDQDDGIRDSNCMNEQDDGATAPLNEESDGDETSMDSKNMDDVAIVESPVHIAEQHSPETSIISSPSSPKETFGINSMKILSKGSKKWIDQPLQPVKSDIYQINKEDIPGVQLQVPESQPYTRTNASLLVEAALDSVCTEPHIDIDVSTTPNCTDALVNNLYNLAPSDALPDVAYAETESRDISLISASVNDHISVTDELSDELRRNRSIGMDYSAFHQEDFSPENTTDLHHRVNFVRNYINNLSAQGQCYQKNLSPVPVPSPPRYDFGPTVPTDHLSSDDSNGMAAQNLSLHSKQDIQLDLSIYKTPYKLDVLNYQNRKDFRIKFDDIEKSKVYGLSMDTNETNALDNEQLDTMNQSHLPNEIEADNIKDKDEDEDQRNNKYPDHLSTDIRNKFDIDLDMRLKSYEVDDNLRSRGLYETGDLDLRNKNYNQNDNLENRNRLYDSAIDSDFRSDRNFEPLVLNSSELQGLDMSARSFHNYSNMNRYHHLYPDVDRVDLRLNYSPPAPTYSHADILRVVSLDLTPPGRHSVDLSLRSHPLHQITNSRLLSEPHRLLDQGRLLGSDLGGRLLSDHTTNRILSNQDQLTSNHLLNSEQRLLSEDSRIIPEQPRLLEQSRLIGDGRILAGGTSSGAVSPIPFGGYAVSQSSYHPTTLGSRSHISSPTPTPYHYATYY